MENEEMDLGQAQPTVIEPDAYGGYAPDVQTVIHRLNSKRSSTRNESKTKVDFSHDRIQRSFQDGKVNNNLTKLQSLMRSSSGTLFKRKCNALITVLETLLVPADYKVRIDDLCVKGEKSKDLWTSKIG